MMNLFIGNSLGSRDKMFDKALLRLGSDGNCQRPKGPCLHARGIAWLEPAIRRARERALDKMAGYERRVSCGEDEQAEAPQGLPIVLRC
jgi:hypothetical protein